MNKEKEIKDEVYIYKCYSYQIVGLRIEKYIVNEVEDELEKEGLINKYEGMKKQENDELTNEDRIKRYENERHILVLVNTNKNSKNIYHELQLSLEGNRVIVLFKKVSSANYMFQIKNRVVIDLNIKYFIKNFNIYLNRPDYNIYINEKKNINNIVFQVYKNKYFIDMDIFNFYPISIKRKIWIFYGDNNSSHIVNFIKDATIFDSNKIKELPKYIYEDIVIIDKRYNPNDIFCRIPGNCEFILVNFSKISKNDEKIYNPTHPCLVYKNMNNNLLSPDNIR